MIQKFRIYLPEYREILEVSNILWTKEGIDYINTNVPTEVEDRDEFYPDGELIYLMQYTGLKDKNGVEIYEGDIVKVTQYFGGMACGGLIHLVEKSKYNNNLMLIRQSKQRFLPELSLRFNRSDDYEVIGNIYENPELLEVAERITGMSMREMK